MNYLTEEQIEEIHHRMKVSDDHEGGVRNRGILYLVTVHAKKESDPFMVAASYAHDISHLQPFLDRNRRTAFAAASISLRTNGYKLSPKNIPDLMTDAKNGLLTTKDIANKLRSLSTKKKEKDYEEALDWFIDNHADLVDKLSKLP